MPKKENIRKMFDDIAPDYDRLNHILSLDVDRLWRRSAVRDIPEGLILDVACGTGDSTVAIASRLSGGSRVIGVDISEGMLSQVPAKAEAAGVADRVETETGDCEDLRFDDDTFDMVFCAFGIRNFEHRDRGLSEMLRVLKPDGKLVILELSLPRNPLLRWCYKLYFMHILPRIGGAVSGDRAAYRYLPASVLKFPPPAAFTAEIAAAGFRNIGHKSFTFGLCRQFTAVK